MHSLSSSFNSSNINHIDEQGRLWSRLIIDQLQHGTHSRLGSELVLIPDTPPLTVTHSRLVALSNGQPYCLRTRQLFSISNMRFKQIVDIDIPYHVTILTLNDQGQLGRYWTDYEGETSYTVLAEGVKLIVPGTQGIEIVLSPRAGREAFFLTGDGWKCYRKGLINDEGSIYSVENGPEYEDIIEFSYRQVITKKGIFDIKTTLIPYNKYSEYSLISRIEVRMELSP